jgi:hypothetical protein
MAIVSGRTEKSKVELIRARLRATYGGKKVTFSTSIEVRHYCVDSVLHLQGPSAEKTDVPQKTFRHEEEIEERTTVMLRNLPDDFSREMVKTLLDEHGLAGQYDFIYVPQDFKRNAPSGYAFVNFTHVTSVGVCREKLEGFSEWCLPSGKTCSVLAGESHHGLQSQVERYRNSPIMHESVADVHKPAIYAADGTRQPFPPPTKPLKAPRVRNARAQ